MTPDATSLHIEMTSLCEALAPDEGVTPSALAGVKFGRSNVSMPRHPVLYEPGIFILCRGRKRGYLGDRVFSYGAHQFLLLTVPMPFEAETIVAGDGPLLGVSIQLDLGVAAELALAIDPHAEATNTAEGIAATELDAPLADAVVRLLRALRSRSAATSGRSRRHCAASTSTITSASTSRPSRRRPISAPRRSTRTSRP